MAHTLDGQGDRQAATTAYEESVVLFRETGDQWALTHPLSDLAWRTWDDGRLDEAIELMGEYLAVFRRLRSLGGVPMALGNLTYMAVMMGDLEAAAQTAHEKYEIEVSRGLPIDRAYGLSSIAFVHLAQGDLARARSLLEESLALARNSADAGFLADQLYNLGLVALFEDHLDEAAQRLEESRRVGEGSENYLLEPQALFWLGQVAARRREYAAALALMQESLTRLQVIWPHIPPRLEGIAQVCLALNQLERGTMLLGAADSLRQAMGSPVWPVSRPDVGQTLAGLRASLGANAFAEAWAAGETMAVDQAVALALERMAG